MDEVILAYPGFYAIAIYRVAHALHPLGLPLLPRLLTEFAHQQTGVDIHPGATIGRRFVHRPRHGRGDWRDHGHRRAGEALPGRDAGRAGGGEGACPDKKRHPTIEDDVVVYANATILGGETVVGQGSVIGGNAWLTQSVPPRSIVTRRSEVRPAHRTRRASRARVSHLTQSRHITSARGRHAL